MRILRSGVCFYLVTASLFVTNVGVQERREWFRLAKNGDAYVFPITQEKIPGEGEGDVLR